MRFGLPLGALYWEHPMDRDPRAKELANLKEALANFEHQLDAFEARVGYPSTAPQVHCRASADPHLTSTAHQIAFANEVVAAMKNRMTEGRAVAAMRQGELSWRR
jgi:glycerol dehydrogenase-like iron-containing ADH family enzyme